MPDPVDEIGIKKQKLACGLSVTVILALCFVVVYVCVTNVQQYPLIFSHDQTLPALPYFHICFLPTNFPNLRGAAVFLIGNSASPVWDCTFGTLKVLKINQTNDGRGCSFISQVFESVNNMPCIRVSGNDSIWNNVQERTVALFVMTHSDELDPNGGWPVVRLTKFYWVDPAFLFNDSSQALSCNLVQVPADGMSLMDFHAELNVSDAKGICYVSSNNYVPYQPYQRDRLCRYFGQQLNNGFNPVSNCSDIISLLPEKNGTLQLFHLRMRLTNFFLHVYEAETTLGLIFRIFSNIGGLAATVLQILFVLFSVVLTRIIFWKQPDAYFSDEIRLAATYFTSKQEKSRLTTP